MKSLIQFKRFSILPLLIAPALIVGAFTPIPALATPQCGFMSTNLLFRVPRWGPTSPLAHST
jgi:hypothetical protein